MKYLLKIILFFFTVFLSAQQIEKEINLLNSIFESLPKEKLKFEIYKDSLPIYLFTFKTLKKTNLKDSLIKAEIEVNKRNLGLEIKSSGQYTFKNSSFDSFNLIENSKYYALLGPKLDLLKNGLKNKKYIDKILNDERKINQFLFDDDQNKMEYSYRYQNIITHFNQILENEYILHQKIILKEIELYYALYYKNLITYPQVLQLLKKKEELQLQINQVNDFPKNIYDTEKQNDFSIFNIDIQSLKNNYLKQNKDDSIIYYQNKINLEQLKLDNMPSFGVGLQMLLTQNAQNPKIYPQIAFNFSMPFFRKKDKKVLAYESEILREKLQFEKDNRFREIENIYYEFSENLKQLKNLYYQLKIGQEQLISAQIIKQNIETSTAIQGINALNLILDTKREMIDLSRLMYLKSLKIFTLADIYSEKEINNYLIPVHWMKENEHIYLIWNTENDQTEMNFYLQYIQKKHYSKIILTGNKNIDNIKKTLNEKGITIFNNPENFEIINVKEFNSMGDLQNKIMENNNSVILNDLHTLILLDLKSL